MLYVGQWLDDLVEAVIVAGGLGTRLMPLTESYPKHLLPVAGVPFVAHQLAKLSAAGISRVLLATSYHADRFGPALGDGSRWKIDLVYVTEGSPLGTGGAIRNAAPSLLSGSTEPVVILNGDVLSDHHLQAQLAFHRDRSADVTLHLVEVADARPYGSVPTDERGNVAAFSEKSSSPVSPQINAGCYVFRRDVIDAIPAQRVVSVEREVFPSFLVGHRRVVGYLENAYWRDLGTPDALRKASADLVLGVTSSPAYRHDPAPAWISPAAAVSTEASVTGGSSVNAGAEIAAGARVDGSVVCSGAVIGASADVVNCVVGPAARIGDGARLEEAVIGDRAVIAEGRQVPPGTTVACRAHL
jgi:mannose-1-phosphate guanylyltransferase